MKYLIYTLFYYPETNGVSRCVDYRCHYLRENNESVTLVMPDYPELSSCSQVQSLKEAGVEIVTVPVAERTENDDSWFANHDGLKVVDAILAEQEFDVFIVDEPMMLFMVSGFRLAMLKHLTSIQKTVAVCHGCLPDLYRSYGMQISALQAEAVKRDIYDDYDSTFIPTQYVFDRYELSRKAKVVPFLGVDKAFYCPRPTERTRSVLNVLYVGRIAQEKNVELLFETAIQLNAQGHTDIAWHFVGEGPLYQQLEEHAPDYVNVHGELHGEALLAAYQNADVFVTACDFEAFGLTVAEAMSCGLPVITTNKGGNAEQFDHSIQGYQFDLTNPEALQIAILTLKSDQLLREQMRIEAREAAKDWQQSCSILVDEIQSLLVSDV